MFVKQVNINAVAIAQMVIINVSLTVVQYLYDFQ